MTSLKNLLHWSGSPTFFENVTCSMSGARRSMMMSPRKGHRRWSSVLTEIQVSVLESS